MRSPLRAAFALLAFRNDPDSDEALVGALLLAEALDDLRRLARGR